MKKLLKSATQRIAVTKITPWLQCWKPHFKVCLDTLSCRHQTAERKGVSTVAVCSVQCAVRNMCTLYKAALKSSKNIIPQSTNFSNFIRKGLVILLLYKVGSADKPYGSEVQPNFQHCI